MRVLRSASAVFLSFLLLMAFSVGACASSNAGAVASYNTGLITHSDPKDTGDEVLLIRLNYPGNYEQFRKEMVENAAPNTVRKLRSIDARGITDLSVSSNYFGVIVEPIDGQHFAVDLIGVKDPGLVTVDAAVEGNTLTVTVHGDRNESMMISTVADNRINVVRIGVPADTLQALELQDEKNSCILVDDLDLPLRATVSSGIARVQNEQLTAAIAMECTSGDLIVRAAKVTGPVSMTTSSGDVALIADIVSGRAELTATSGDVTVEAHTLYDAVLRATSGDVNATVTQIVNSVKATVSGGDLSFVLTKAPKNLRFVFDGNEADDDVTLPRGWRNGYRVGNGKPVLHLGVGSGDLELKVG